MLRSARMRILTAILLVAALGMTVAGLAAYALQRERVLAQVDLRLSATVEALQGLAGPPATGGGTAPTTVDDFLRIALQQLVPQPNESVLGIVDGVPTLVPSAGNRYRLDSDPAFLAAVLAAADPQHPVLGSRQGAWGLMRYAIVPVRIGSDPSTGLYVAAYDLDDELNQVSQTFGSYALIAAGTLVLVAVVGWLVAGRALRPVRLVREAAARASEEDLSARIPVRGRDDVSQLAATFNGMLARLEASFGAQRRLLDDVGHELRTPITILRGHLEVLDAADPADVAATRDLALEELRRMQALVEDAATLAKADSPDFVRPAPTDLGELTRSVLTKASALDPDRTWVLDAAGEGVVDLDAGRITQAWLQLAENAAKYATPGTPVGLGSGPSPDGWELWVRDEGPGIPDAQLGRIFERFVRLADGRGADGSGLGLSIVAAIAAAHGGSARAERSHGGSRFLVVLSSDDAEIETAPWPAS